MRNKQKIDICLSPSIIDLFDLSSKKVIIIDVFRATSAMCVFLNNGGNQVIPVSTLEEANKYKACNKINDYRYLVAAERNGAIVPGFDLGNSPLLYHDKNFNGHTLVITTTNGTLAIEKSKELASGMLLASFLNASAIVNYILSSIKEDVLIVCSGWKGQVCVEDLLLAGLLSKEILLDNRFYANSDSVLLANHMYDLAKSNLFEFLIDSAYRKRMNLDEDVKYCLQKDIMSIVPIWAQKNIEPFSDSGYFYLV